MPVPAFDRSDLLSDISDKELDALTTNLINAGDPDPIATTVTEQSARLERYLHFYTVDDDWQKTLLRALVLWRLYQRIGTIPDKRQKSYQDALAEMTQIRDGKFKTIPLTDPAPADANAGRGGYASDDQISDPCYRRGQRQGNYYN